MATIGIGERDGPWYMTEHSVLQAPDQVDKIGRSEWADWSHSGDLLFAMGGALYRARCDNRVLEPLESAIKIADFSDLKFENREAL